MSIPLFLAITAQEFPNLLSQPQKTAWMSVHFSSSGPGLSNLPHEIPQGSLIILDDQTPWSGHSIETVCREMVALLLMTRAYGLLLDFERPVEPEVVLLSRALCQCCREVGCVMGAPESYAVNPDTAIFISPLPCQVPLERLRIPGRKLWLDASPTAYQLHISAHSATGRSAEPGYISAGEPAAFTDQALCCQYRSWLSGDGIDVLLYHTTQTIEEMLEKSNADFIQLAVGLHREFR